MFAAAGVGAFTAAMFHLTTHAFFKALLFLGAGSVIHALHGEQDIRKMGGLKAKAPWTYRTFLIASISIAGILPFAGFFSKDEILWEAFGSNRLIWGVLVVGAVLTAFYMFRLVSMVFWGKFRGGDETWSKAHESTRWMVVPLMILAVLSFVGGGINIPKVLTPWGDWTFLHHWLAPSLSTAHGAADAAHGAGHSTALELGLMALALTGAAIGIFVAIRIYRRLEVAERIAKRLGPIYHLVRNLYWVDELYELVVLRPFYAASRGFKIFDEKVIDGVVHLVRNSTLGLSVVSDLYDRWIVDGLVNAVGYTVRGMSWLLRRLQTGLVQSYVAVMVFGIFVLIVLYTMAR
jgi:NADH-quinone oxidoreductase subunit L